MCCARDINTLNSVSNLWQWRQVKERYKSFSYYNNWFLFLIFVSDFLNKYFRFFIFVLITTKPSTIWLWRSFDRQAVLLNGKINTELLLVLLVNCLFNRNVFGRSVHNENDNHKIFEYQCKYFLQIFPVNWICVQVSCYIFAYAF